MDDMTKLPERMMLRNGVYYHRVRVPLDIRDSYREAHGREFEINSLRTGDRKEAKRLLARKIVEIDEQFERHRAAIAQAKANDPSQTPDAPPLSFAEIARQYAAEVADNEFVFRANLYEKACDDPASLWKGKLAHVPISGGTEEEPSNQYRYFDHLAAEGDIDAGVGYLIRMRTRDRVASLRKNLAIGDIGELIKLARERAPGLDDARYSVLARLLAQAEIEVLTRVVTGEPDDAISAAPTRSNAHTTAQKSTSGPLLSEVARDWKADRTREGKWSEKTFHEREAAVAAFMEICGDKPIDAYRKTDTRRFKDVLFDIPPNAHKKSEYMGLGLVAIAEKARAGGAPEPTIQTVAKKMAAASSLFNWASRNLDTKVENPFVGVKPDAESTPRTDRDPFTLNELKTIFGGPPFTGARSEHYWLQPGKQILNSTGKYWVPLIAAYTGARLMEIVQLRKCDVGTKDGIAFFDLRNDDDLRVKTKTSVRRIPVHPALVKAGLLQLVAKVKNPSDRLFPDIPIGGAKNRSRAASGLFNRLLDTVGVKKKRNCFHSFRHSFEDACREAEIEGRVMDALQGHSDGGMSGRYGSGYSLKRLASEVEKIRYGLEIES